MIAPRPQTTLELAGSAFGASEAKTSLPIEPLAREQALSERVYTVILQMLARGGPKQGSTLRIDLLSKALNVSPTPVREALVPHVVDFGMDL
jgi:hypothetical protein